jgi:Zn-dependent M28 family amino/carboxypeptidase
MDFGPRVPGTEAHDEAVRWIADRLEEAGWEVETDAFSAEGTTGTNVVGRYGEGDAPPILLGAHYDSRPVADRDQASPTEPVPGANDGASGVAVLLELARVLPGDDLSRPVWLAFFDLEDGGGAAGGEWIQGSRAFAADLTPLPAAAVVVDMVGDADLQLREEMNSDPLLRETIWQTAASLGYDSFIPSLGYSMLDDHRPFIDRGIPTVLIIDFDYPYWHTTHDTLDKVSAESLEAVGRTLETWLRAQP